MKHRKEMNPELFAQQSEVSSCGAKVAVAALNQDLRYVSLHFKGRRQIQRGYSQLHLISFCENTMIKTLDESQFPMTTCRVE